MSEPPPQPPPPDGSPRFIAPPQAQGASPYPSNAGAPLPPPPQQQQPQQRYDHERSRWGLGDVAWSLAIFFLGSFGLVFLIVALNGGDTDSFLHGPWLPIAVVGPHVMLLIHVVWVGRTKGAGIVNDFRLRFQVSDLALGFGLFLGGVVAASLIAGIITQISGNPPTASAIELAEESSGDNGLTIWLVLFAILGATVVPLIEELIYRGLLWSALEKRGMPPWAVLVVSSLIFALVHVEPLRTPILFVIGLAIGAGRIITGRIGASVITHMIVNSLAMTATLVELA